jgi:hypothetical protein
MLEPDSDRVRIVDQIDKAGHCVALRGFAPALWLSRSKISSRAPAYRFSRKRSSDSAPDTRNSLRARSLSFAKALPGRFEHSERQLASSAMCTGGIHPRALQRLPAA